MTHDPSMSDPFQARPIPLGVPAGYVPRGRPVDQLPAPPPRMKARVLAAFLDYFALPIVGQVVMLALPFGDGLVQVVTTVLFLLNVVLLQGRTGRSVGKRGAGFQLYVLVRDDDGARSLVAPGVLRCGGRQLVYVVAFALVGAGAVLHPLVGLVLLVAVLVVPVFDPLSRTVADLALRTVVMVGAHRVRSRSAGEYAVGWAQGAGPSRDSGRAQRLTDDGPDAWHGHHTADSSDGDD